MYPSLGESTQLLPQTFHWHGMTNPDLVTQLEKGLVCPQVSDIGQ